MLVLSVLTAYSPRRASDADEAVLPRSRRPASGPDGWAARPTSGTTERPTNKGVWGGLGSVRSIRTASRCTIFTKLPVAFSAGNSDEAAPVAGAKPETRPWKTRLA